MKRKIVLALLAIVSTGILATGCNQSRNPVEEEVNLEEFEQRDGEMPEETNYVD